MVHRHELRRSLAHVLILRLSSDANAHPEMGQHHDHELTDRSDDRRHLG